jgi:hypothetical protein
LANCTYCGNPCKGRTCSKKCNGKNRALNADWHENFWLAGLKAHKENTAKRWAKKIMELVGNKEIFNRKEVAKLLAKQHIQSYSRGYNAGKAMGLSKIV